MWLSLEYVVLSRWAPARNPSRLKLGVLHLVFVSAEGRQSLPSEACWNYHPSRGPITPSARFVDWQVL